MKEKTVVLDCDDVIVDFVGYVCTLHNKQHKTTWTKYDLKEYNLPIRSEATNIEGDMVSKGPFRTFKEYENHGLYGVLPVFEESRQAMQLLKMLNYKIIVLTARDPKFKKVTELFMLHQNLPYDELFFSKDKATLLNELNEKYDIVAFVDDKTETILSVKEKCNIKNVCLMDQPQNRKDKVGNKGIERINSLIELVNILRET